MMRTHSPALALSVISGKCRRNSTMADSSPPSSYARRIASAVGSSTLSMRTQVGPVTAEGEGGQGRPQEGAEAAVVPPDGERVRSAALGPVAAALAPMCATARPRRRRGPGGCHMPCPCLATDHQRAKLHDLQHWDLVERLRQRAAMP